MMIEWRVRKQTIRLHQVYVILTIISYCILGTVALSVAITYGDKKPFIAYGIALLITILLVALIYLFNKFYPVTQNNLPRILRIPLSPQLDTLMDKVNLELRDIDKFNTQDSAVIRNVIGFLKYTTVMNSPTRKNLSKTKDLSDLCELVESKLT